MAKINGSFSDGQKLYASDVNTIVEIVNTNAENSKHMTVDNADSVNILTDSAINLDCEGVLSIKSRNDYIDIHTPDDSSGGIKLNNYPILPTKDEVTASDSTWSSEKIVSADEAETTARQNADAELQEQINALKEPEKVLETIFGLDDFTTTSSNVVIDSAESDKIVYHKVETTNNEGIRNNTTKADISSQTFGSVTVAFDIDTTDTVTALNALSFYLCYKMMDYINLTTGHLSYSKTITRAWMASNSVDETALYAQFVSRIAFTDLRISNFKIYTDTAYQKYLDDGTQITTDDLQLPQYIYTVANNSTSNFDTARQNSATLYLDHCTKTYDNTTKFLEDGSSFGDRLYFSSPSYYSGSTQHINGDSDTIETEKTVELTSDTYKYPSGKLKVRSTKSSVSKAKFPKLLVIGDSITGGTGVKSTDAGGGGQYWLHVKKLFEMDRIDGGNNADEYNFLTLGQFARNNLSLEYKGTTKEINCSAAGYGGWKLANHLHHPYHIADSQTTWDALGLGDGTNADYTGSSEQKILINKTNYPNYIGTPQNEFFDSDKTGDVKFSIAKWLERYRTLDDNGDRLTLQSANIGTEITSSNLNTINVCTPTHVLIMHGRNDLTIGIDTYIHNLNLLIADLKEEIPNVVIGIGLTPDVAMTYFPERYPDVEFVNDMTSYYKRDEFAAAKTLMETYGSRESENIWIVPTYFVQPTGMAFAFQDVSSYDGSTRLKPMVNYPTSHCGKYAHMAWAYQIYSWLKWEMSQVNYEHTNLINLTSEGPGTDKIIRQYSPCELESGTYNFKIEFSAPSTRISGTVFNLKSSTDGSTQGNTIFEIAFDEITAKKLVLMKTATISENMHYFYNFMSGFEAGVTAKISYAKLS